MKTIRVMSIIGIIYFVLHLLTLGGMINDNPEYVTSGMVISALYGLILSIVGVYHTNIKKASTTKVIEEKTPKENVFETFDPENPIRF